MKPSDAHDARWEVWFPLGKLPGSLPGNTFEGRHLAPS
jgi:hypothetical protein